MGMFNAFGEFMLFCMGGLLVWLGIALGESLEQSRRTRDNRKARRY